MKTNKKEKRIELSAFQSVMLNDAKSLRIKGGNGGDEEDESAACVLDNGSG